MKFFITFLLFFTCTVSYADFTINDQVMFKSANEAFKVFYVKGIIENGNRLLISTSGLHNQNPEELEVPSGDVSKLVDQYQDINLGDRLVLRFRKISDYKFVNVMILTEDGRVCYAETDYEYNEQNRINTDHKKVSLRTFLGRGHSIYRHCVENPNFFERNQADKNKDLLGNESFIMETENPNCLERPYNLPCSNNSKLRKMIFPDVYAVTKEAVLIQPFPSKNSWGYLHKKWVPRSIFGQRVKSMNGVNVGDIVSYQKRDSEFNVRKAKRLYDFRGETIAVLSTTGSFRRYPGYTNKPSYTLALNEEFNIIQTVEEAEQISPLSCAKDLLGAGNFKTTLDIPNSSHSVPANYLVDVVGNYYLFTHSRDHGSRYYTSFTRWMTADEFKEIVESCN